MANYRKTGKNASFRPDDIRKGFDGPFEIPAWQKSAKPLQRRKNTTPKNAYRPESFVSRAKSNSRVLNQIKGRPVRNSWPRMPAPVSAKRKPFSLAFTMPLLPVLGLFILGIIFFADNNASISAMVSRDVIPAPDAGGEINMAAYVDGRNMAAVQPEDLSAMSVTDAVSDNPVNTAPAVSAVPAAAVPSAAEAAVNESIPLRMVEYFAWESYTVKRGDSVSSIAAAHGLSMDAVIASNNLTNAHLLKTGQILRIPNMNGIPYTVKSGDTLYKISLTHNIPLDVLVDVNNIQRDLIIPGQNIFLPGARMPAGEFRLAIGTYFLSPLRGTAAKLSSGYGWRDDPFGAGRRFHEAVDMSIAQGTPVKAASGGRISHVGNNAVYGKFIIINHSENFQTMYAHLSVCSVKEGDTVEQGSKIGEVGNTGMSTGPHLHFAVYKNGHAVNPLDYFTM